MMHLQWHGANAMQYLTAESTFWQLEPGVNIVTFSTPSGSVVVSSMYPAIQESKHDCQTQRKRV